MSAQPPSTSDVARAEGLLRVALDAEPLEHGFVLGVVHAGDSARLGPALAPRQQLGELADDQVVFVVSRRRDDHVGALHAGLDQPASLVGHLRNDDVA